MVEVDDLTVVAQDYLKVIWTATERDEPPITTTGLAARLGTSAPNVSETLRRLAGQGLVTYEPYRPVRLTAAGERLAIGMVRRHRLIEAFLVQVLGYGWDEVHEEAERLEHAVSDQLLGRIDALLGHPSRDPHGHQIPTAAGALPLPGGLARLSDCAPGRYRVVEVSDADPAVLGELDRLGISPGTEVDTGLPEAVRPAIWVLPADTTRS